MSSFGAPGKVSFTVRRPSPVSRQGSSGPDSDSGGQFKVPALPKRLTESGRSRPGSPLANGKASPKPSRPPSRRANVDSSDEEDEAVDEMITGFDQFGAERLNGKKKDEGPLVIPALANRDWREAARKRKAVEMFVPAAGAAKTGADGSVGGLGTTDTINSEPLVSGLVRMEKKTKMDVDSEGNILTQEVTTTETVEVREETEDEKAMRALIAKASGEQDPDAELLISAISSGDNDLTRPADETDAYRRDVVTRPDQASLEDYERVPVEQFGAALLRGMGWKPGQAASRTRTGPSEPYLPAARPALLGLGAKERNIVDDGSDSKKPTRPEKRYVPLVKKERERSGRDPGSAPSSRRNSRSPEPNRRQERGSDGERATDRQRDYDYYKRRDRHHERDYGHGRKGRRNDGDYKRDQERHGNDDAIGERRRENRDREKYF
ncbi:uncharacterized protein FOMMEDRAFT_147414 [Fomitiporia mediterranea MF3/22]|uniref:uncharacterized protein n=1 Tax=Fomitiporia mediterranea (strain MF3/22) TaxID=694068 RepID=UPI0004408114|nr:uncharacterized protein FOMMEDRAFT_147414 [Fomitiporia mediterranea MF3/22]EJD02447.1 hypothetical protein FOMMEDRAFT_147414 [Fomitiporia mediterranea MF3/22]